MILDVDTDLEYNSIQFHFLRYGTFHQAIDLYIASQAQVALMHIKVLEPDAPNAHSDNHDTVSEDPSASSPYEG